MSATLPLKWVKGDLHTFPQNVWWLSLFLKNIFLFSYVAPFGTINVLAKIRGNFPSFPISFCLQCFDAVGWAAGRASGLEKNEWWGTGVVILSVWSKVQTCIWPSWCHCYSLSPASVKRAVKCVCVPHVPENRGTRQRIQAQDIKITPYPQSFAKYLEPSIRWFWELRASNTTHV